MKLTIGNYFEKSENIDFSKLDKGDFFARKHPEIITIIENMDDEGSADDIAKIKAIVGTYLDRLNADIEANPSAMRTSSAQKASAKKSKQKNLKTKKLNTQKRKRQPKPKATKPSASEKKTKAPKERKAKQPKAKNKKPKFKVGQVFYEYKADKTVQKSRIDRIEFEVDGEPVYILDGYTRAKEGLMVGLIKSKVASIDKPLPIHTEKVPVEISFLRRHVGMDGKTKTRDEILALLKSLQTAIVERKIRKTSPYAAQIEEMQTDLLRLEEAARGESKILVEFPEKRRNDLKAIVGGVSTMPAVNVIKSFLKIQGKSDVKEEARKISESINSAKATLNASDVLHSKLRAISKSLDDYLSGNSSTIKIGTSELNGLMGLEGIETVKGKKVEPKTGKAMSSVDFAKQDFYPIGLNGKWKVLLGELCAPFRLMVYGKGGHGKSTLSLEFAHYLADQMGNSVLFVSKEEGFVSTLKDKIIRLKAVHPDLEVVDELIADLSKYDVVFLDSADSLRLTPQQAETICKKYPNLSLVTIHKVTKSGNFRGSAEWEHDCDTSVNVSDGVAKAEKNRFGGNGEISVF